MSTKVYKTGERLDSSNAATEQPKILAILDGGDNAVIDLSGCNYVSSAGLRVLLSAQKTMNKQGSMVVRNVSEEVREIFDVTGFVDILNIEE